MDQLMTRSAVVVMERGSPWPLDAATIGAAPAITAILQQPDETPDALTTRTIRRLLSLAAVGRTPASATISCSDDDPADVLASRARMALAMVSSMVPAGRGRVTFAAEGVKDPRSRSQLLALAGALSDEIGEASVSVSVRFA